jgi:AcrR family transcriptional regulator
MRRSAPLSRGSVRGGLYLDAASRVFARAGFAGTSIDMIATEAGWRARQIYNQIGDKEKGLRGRRRGHDRERQCRALRGARRLPDRPGDLEAELVALRAGFLACVCDRRAAALHKLVESEGQRYPELFAAWRERGPGRIWSAVSAPVAARP